MADIVTRIRGLCREKGVTFAQFETESGLGARTVAKWADHVPSLEKVQKAAAYFGMTVSELIGEVPEDTERDELLESFRTRPEMKMLFKSMSSATPEAVRATASFLEGLKNGGFMDDE